MFTNSSRPSAIDTVRPFVVGDLFYADTTTTLAKLAIGTNGQVLQVNSTIPGWTSTIAPPGLTANRIVATNSAGGMTTPSSISADQALTLTTASGISTLQAATQDAVRMLGRAGGTSSFVQTITTAALSASRTFTLPDAAMTITGGGTLALGGFTLTVPATGTADLIDVTQTVTGTKTFRNASGITTDQASTQDAMRLLGRAGGTSSYIGTLTPTTLSASRTYTFPDAAIVVSGSASALTSGRVPFVTTGGLLTDSSNFAWNGSALLVTGNIGANAADPFSRSPGRCIGINSTSGNAGFYIAAPTGSNCEFYGGVNGTLYGGFTVTTTVFNLISLNSAAITLSPGGSTAMTLSGTTITLENTVNFAFNTSTGTKIATATNQKMAFWNATPIVQPSSTGETTGWTSGGGSAATSTDTYTGNTGTKAYTVNDIVKHLKNIGAFAAS